MSRDGIADMVNNVAAVGGLPVKNDEGNEVLPRVRVVENINVVAMQLGNLCARLPIFRKGEFLVYFNGDGEEVVMTGRRFRGWVNQYVNLVIRFRGGDDVSGTLGRDDAATIVEMEPFLKNVRKIRNVARVRMPVRRKSGEIELLPEGYDEETETFTHAGPKVDEGWGLERAIEWFKKNFGGFPFNRDRDMAVHVAAMLAVYCPMLMPKRSLRPGFLWLANKAGSGKSVLAKAALYPVFGKVSSAKLKSGDELDKELEAFSRAAVPYIFLDNVYNKLESASLDQLLTSCFTMGRAMGGHSIFEAENRAMIYITGNNLKLNDDAYRRFLIVDLFEKGEPADRKFEVKMDDELMSSDAWRSDALSALWAMVRTWQKGGCEVNRKKLASYESFSEIIGGIVWAAGFEDAFEPPDAANVISPDKAEFNQLLREIVADLKASAYTTKDYTLEEIAMMARRAEIFAEKVGTYEDGRLATVKRDGIRGAEASQAVDCGYLDNSQRQRLVKFLKPHVGTEPVVDDVRLKFGERTQQRKTCFSISIMG